MLRFSITLDLLLRNAKRQKGLGFVHHFYFKNKRRRRRLRFEILKRRTFSRLIGARSRLLLVLCFLNRIFSGLFFFEDESLSLSFLGEGRGEEAEDFLKLSKTLTFFFLQRTLYIFFCPLHSRNPKELCD